MAKGSNAPGLSNTADYQIMKEILISMLIIGLNDQLFQ